MEGQSFYDVLGVSKHATGGEIKKAYRRLVLLAHPDKLRAQLPDTEEARQQAHDHFLQLQRVYETLIDDEKRAYYDETGRCLDDESADGGLDRSTVEDLLVFYRTAFRRVTEEDIAAFEGKYRESDMERADLLDHYRNMGGRVEHVVDHIPYSSEEDLQRFMDCYDECIRQGTLQRTPAYQRARQTLLARARKRQGKAKRTRQAGGRRVEAGRSTTSLASTILARRSEREAEMQALCERLVEKYAANDAPQSARKKKRSAGTATSRKTSANAGSRSQR
ncbi:hypothetical protein CDCA_CDCA10G2967 [Cyanidium caldarium]|uniref:J domain-containing protein n=1 Tax=Cyanidium caldarium TaxID=2771 RepID=A0AAV9IX83_CYACA|nr:hypothetical protein CDCA_CDCA10G2967 [Cyanidium caldarium]